MIDFWLVLGAVGSIASLVGLLLPSNSRGQRTLHVAYGIAIAILASAAVWYWQENQRIHKVERGADRILTAFEFSDENLGFIQTVLAFLEKNKDLYPDTYERAQEICKQNNCSSPKYTNDSYSGITYDNNLRNVASAFKGLIRGIGALERGS